MCLAARVGFRQPQDHGAEILARPACRPELRDGLMVEPDVHVAIGARAGSRRWMLPGGVTTIAAKGVLALPRQIEATGLSLASLPLTSM